MQMNKCPVLKTIKAVTTVSPLDTFPPQFKYKALEAAQLL
jgi:hypothetical protein